MEAEELIETDEEMREEADELEKEWDDASRGDVSGGYLMPWLIPLLLIAGFLLVVTLAWVLS